MTVPIYRLQNVQVRYADRLALDVEHLEIAPGRSWAWKVPTAAARAPSCGFWPSWKPLFPEPSPSGAPR